MAGPVGGCGVALRQVCGKDRSQLSESIWSYAPPDQLLVQPSESPQVQGSGQSRQKLLPRHLSGDCGAAISKGLQNVADIDLCIGAEVKTAREITVR